MASDSRLTYNSTKNETDGSKTILQGTHFTDTVYKTFCSEKGVGISYCGDADVNGIPLSVEIEQFLREHKQDGVEKIKDDILGYFKALCSTLDTEFFVAGYEINDKGLPTQHLYRINILQNSIEPLDTSTQGIIWGGHKNIISRLLSSLYLKNDDGSYTQHTENEVLWNYFTIQDAIDYARYAIQVTIDTMRFQKVVKTVGGSIDLLVIKPEGTKWICRKELH